MQITRVNSTPPKTSTLDPFSTTTTPRTAMFRELPPMKTQAEQTLAFINGILSVDEKATFEAALEKSREYSHTMFPIWKQLQGIVQKEEMERSNVLRDYCTFNGTTFPSFKKHLTLPKIMIKEIKEQKEKLYEISGDQCFESMELQHKVRKEKEACKRLRDDKKEFKAIVKRKLDLADSSESAIKTKKAKNPMAARELGRGRGSGGTSGRARVGNGKQWKQLRKTVEEETDDKFEDENRHGNEVVEATTKRKRAVPKRYMSVSVSNDSDDDSKNDSADWECKKCLSDKGKPEDYIGCDNQKCLRWFHVWCVGTDVAPHAKFFCEMCKNECN